MHWPMLVSSSRSATEGDGRLFGRLVLLLIICWLRPLVDCRESVENGELVIGREGRREDGESREVVCHGLDIRNNPQDAYMHSRPVLGADVEGGWPTMPTENCTVIEGSLSIAMVTQEDSEPEDYPGDGDDNLDDESECRD